MEKAIGTVAFIIIVVFAVIGVVSLMSSRSSVDGGYVGLVGNASIGIEYRGSAPSTGYDSVPPYRDNVPSWLHVRRE
jgi:hypothetical protein